ncbi:glycoside hydrolase family 2 protein [Microbacterium sp. NPDC089696]|uniref:glycoside hydrolase family 2 protein n=1 Tax=Microbacterium sp. NPDC089696 TaxID=3364199 RepID=UPI0037F56F6B
MLHRTLLADSWSLDVLSPPGEESGLTPDRLPLTVTVPGSVHTDLLAAGVIPDPYLDLNELDLAWIGRTSWVYRRTLSLSEGLHTHTDLVFEGLDTLATIAIDGDVASMTANMFRTYRLSLDAYAGRTIEIAVTFDSAWRPFDQASDDDRAAYGAAPSFIRKMACNFGWDWGPALVTAGIWRPVWVETWSAARLADIRPSVTVDIEEDDIVGRVNLTVKLERDRAERPIAVEIEVAGRTETARIAASSPAVVFDTTVPLAPSDLWWPRGYGEQPLHDLVVRVRDEGSGDVLDEAVRRIGFRNSTVDMTPDADGTPFVFVVNGTPIPIRGFNWIPDDCFPHRVDRTRIDERLAAAVEANANMIRVWGGGLYESDDFYDACDELGLLVWQDFAFACAPYPETQELRDEIEAEARENVTRLMRHPSLVLWNGNNENWLGWDDWDWKPRLAGRPWGEGYYLDLLPRVVAELHPNATYWPGSPYSGSPDVYSNDRSHGVVHLWDAWNSEGYAVFRQDRPRFASEFGWQAPPAWRTLTDAVHDDPMTPTSPGVLHHQKAIDGNGKLSRGLAPYFDEPTDMADWHWAMQLNQARAIRFSVEHFRSLRPLNMGVILWQLNDCWPVASWAVVDGAGRRRPGWFATRDVYAPRLATIQPRGDGLALILVNDTAVQWSGQAHIRRVGLDGEQRAIESVDFVTAAGDATEISLGEAVSRAAQPDAELLVADIDGAERAWWYYVSDRDFAYPDPGLSVQLIERLPENEGVLTEVVVRAENFVRDLTIHPDRLGEHVTVDRMLVTLLPGETGVFRFTGVIAAASEEAVVAAIRHAGDLVERRVGEKFGVPSS